MKDTGSSFREQRNMVSVFKTKYCRKQLIKHNSTKPNGFTSIGGKYSSRGLTNYQLVGESEICRFTNQWGKMYCHSDDTPQPHTQKQWQRKRVDGGAIHLLLLLTQITSESHHTETEQKLTLPELGDIRKRNNNKRILSTHVVWTSTVQTFSLSVVLKFRTCYLQVDFQYLKGSKAERRDF